MSKIEAARIAAEAGCKVVLADGRLEGVIGRIVAGEELGTLFLPRRRLSNRKRWILNARAEGRIEIDSGAATALRENRSLLAVGITGVAGRFERGAVVQIGDVAKGVCGVSADELRQALRQKGEGVRGSKRRAVVHANDIVVLDA